VSKLRGGSDNVLPPYVALAGEYSSDPAEPAYLGPAHRPFMPRGGDLANLGLKKGMTLDRLEDRKALLRSFDALSRELDARGGLAGADAFQERALTMICSSRTRDAFDL